jgi:arylsulfatase
MTPCFLSPALRKGKYKIVHVPVVFGGRKDGKWQLYDLAADPGETKDLSEELPEKYKELLDEWEQYVLDAGVVWGDAKPPVANVQDVKWQE